MSESQHHGTLREQAIAALQGGRTGEARRLLAALLQQDPRDADAWAWLGSAMDDPTRRRECFTRALRLDPDHEAARRGMIGLLSGPGAAPDEGPAVTPSPSPGSAELLDEEEGGAPPKQISAYPARCPSCGAALRYDVAARALRCAHCGTEKDLPSPSHLVEWLGMPPDLSGPDAQGELVRRETLRCRSCGATTELSSRTASLSCPYCGSPQVIRGKGSNYLIPPRALVPFGIGPEAAEEALRTWLAEGYWHPDDLAGRAELAEMHGAYLPFWGFKGLAEVTFQMEGGISVESMPILPGQQIQHINVDEVLIPGSLSVDQNLVRHSMPFDLAQAVPFHPEYLAGWPAEVYQVALADATIEARGRMSKQARNKADALASVMSSSAVDDYDIGGLVNLRTTGRRSHNRQPSFKPTVATIRLDSFMHYLLPLWLGSYRYRGRSYSFAVNGQSGKVGGQAPRGGANSVLAIVLGVVTVAAVSFLLWRFWPQVVALFRRLFEPGPSSSAGGMDPQTLLYVAVGIMGVVVFLLFTAAANWSKIRAWFGGKEEGPRDS